MLRLTTLGALDLRDRHGHALRDVLAQPKRVALLAYLAVEGATRPVTRDRLLALLWPDSDEAHARNALSQALHHLRQALGPGLLDSQGSQRIGVDRERLWCDATVFVEALERGETGLALDLYRGEFCPALFVSGCSGLEHWLDEQRRALHGRALAALRAEAERGAACGDHEAAAHAARRALAMRPDDEAHVRALLALLERAGDSAGALLAYREYAQRLADELEMRPAAETVALVTKIRDARGLPAAAPAAAVASAAATPASVAAGALGARPAAVPPGEPARSRGASPVRRRLLTAALTTAALALAAAGVAIWRAEAGSGPAVDANAVATFPFTVSGDSALGFLRDGMVDLLDARLDGAGGLRTVDPHAMQAAVAGAARGAPLSPGLGRQLSRRLGARLFVLGEVVATKGRIHLDAALYDAAQAAPLAQARADGEADRLFALVDALAGQLLANRPEGPDARLTRAAALTTGSLDALRAYVDGERAYREGRYQVAEDAFERATTIDSAFALAWYRLSIVRDWLGGVAREAAEHALAHQQTLAPRERELVNANWLYQNLHPEAERAANVVVTQRPDDAEAWTLLAETQYHLAFVAGRSFTDSRGAFARVLELDPGNPNALLHLVRIAAAERDTMQVDSLGRLFLARHPDADRALEVRTLRAYALGDALERSGAVAALARAGDVTLDVAVREVAAYAGDITGAERLAPLLEAPARTTYFTERGRGIEAELALAAGRWQESARRLDALAATDPDWALELRAVLAAQPFTPATPAELAALRDALQRWRPSATSYRLNTNFATQRPAWPMMRRYLLGLISVRLGDTAAAARAAAEIDRVASRLPDSAWEGDFAHSVRAEIAWRAGAPRAALAEVEQIHYVLRAPLMGGTLHGSSHERFLHAELLHALGRDEEALRWYGSFPEPSGYDITYLAPAALRQAEISERLGRRADALAFYRRAASLWVECDPPLRPLLAQAQRGVRRLSGS